MTLRSAARQNQSAKEYYAQLFKPSYDAFLAAAKQTPLVIMLWGPRRPSLEWSKTRLKVRNTLQQLGHTVYLSEQLGIPASASTQKAVEYLQRDAVDLTVVIQASYGLVGTVPQFVEFRVVDSKMLLFIDAAAPDNYLYDRAVSDLRNLYDNVETYQLPDDIVRDDLLRKILTKVGLMQIVKHRAMQRARGWSLRLDPAEPASAPVASSPQPFRYNLLELYREHRDEIDTFNDLMRLFFLAYLSESGHMPLKALSKDVGLAEDSLLEQIAPLLRGAMISQADGILSATAYGQRMLNGLNLPVRAATLPVRKAPRALPTIMRTRLATLTAGAGLALAAFFLFALTVINSLIPVQNRQPLVFTPLPPSITATATAIPPRTLTPAPPSR